MATNLPVGTFIFLEDVRPGTYTCQPVCLVVSTNRVDRLWDDSRPVRWQEGLGLGELDPWLEVDVGRRIITRPDDPDYGEWWAWYCGCRMGVIQPPPGFKEKRRDQGKL